MDRMFVFSAFKLAVSLFGCVVAHQYRHFVEVKNTFCARTQFCECTSVVTSPNYLDKYQFWKSNPVTLHEF